MKTTTFVFAALMICGCSDSSSTPQTDMQLDGNPPSCPTAKPSEATACTLPAGTQCTYFKESCNSGGTYVVNDVCTCTAVTGGTEWACMPDCLDCCRPMDGGADFATSDTLAPDLMSDSSSDGVAAD